MYDENPLVSVELGFDIYEMSDADLEQVVDDIFVQCHKPLWSTDDTRGFAQDFINFCPADVNDKITRAVDMVLQKRYKMGPIQIRNRISKPCIINLDNYREMYRKVKREK